MQEDFISFTFEYVDTLRVVCTFGRQECVCDMSELSPAFKMLTCNKWCVCVRVYEYRVVVEVAEMEGEDLDKDSYNILYPLSHQF